MSGMDSYAALSGLSIHSLKDAGFRSEAATPCAEILRPFRPSPNDEPRASNERMQSQQSLNLPTSRIWGIAAHGPGASLAMTASKGIFPYFSHTVN